MCMDKCLCVMFECFLNPIYDTGGNVVAEAFSAATGAVPASIPFSPLWATLLWWLPLDDFGRTYDHLREIRRHLSIWHGLEVETVLVHEGRGRSPETERATHVEVYKSKAQ